MRRVKFSASNFIRMGCDKARRAKFKKQKKEADDISLRRYARHKRDRQNHKQSLYSGLSADDFVIVLGDFGLFWSERTDELLARKNIERYFPATLLFIDGNHENFDMLDGLPRERKFGGTASVGGEIYEIAGRRFLCFGGALSVDKAYRIPGLSWWAREIPSEEEFSYAMRNAHDFIAAGGRIDAVLSHTAPGFAMKFLKEYLWCGKSTRDKTSEYLERIFELVRPARWYFGHFHGDKKFHTHGCDFYLCYDEILKFED